MAPSGPARRFLLALLLAVGFVAILYLGSFRGVSEGGQPRPGSVVPVVKEDNVQEKGNVQLTGHAIAPKLGNATAK